MNIPRFYFERLYQITIIFKTPRFYLPLSRSIIQVSPKYFEFHSLPRIQWQNISFFLICIWMFKPMYFIFCYILCFLFLSNLSQEFISSFTSFIWIIPHRLEGINTPFILTLKCRTSHIKMVEIIVLTRISVPVEWLCRSVTFIN